MSTLEHVAGQYKTLCFNAIANSLEPLLKQAQDNELSYLQFAQLLADHELRQRDRKRIENNRKRASFPVPKFLEEFDFQHQTTITKRQVNALLDFSFLDQRENLVFIGPPGVGKTHLAVSIGIKAIDRGYKVLFTSALGLIESLELAELKGELKNKINTLLKFDLLILDELGYLPMNKQGMYNLFQLIHAMYEYRSLLITTNKDFTAWGEFFFDDNVAVPIVDRIIHHSHIFMLGGESYRLRKKLNS
ncbi:MAG: ATP-binding protein [Gammaproteobacteria bacterium]|nr:ATP-binding protein [Gammaproteobacteria bacterium]